MDLNEMQQHRYATTATHHALDGMSEQPDQFRRDPMLALLDAAHQARSGQDGGFNAMTVPF